MKPIVVQPRNSLNHLERGLQNATAHLTELSNAVFETRLNLALAHMKRARDTELRR